MKISFNILVISLCLLRFSSICAQQQICLDFKTQFASTGFITDGSIHTIQNNSPFFNQSSIFAGLQYKIGKYIGIGCYISDQKTQWKFSDKVAIPMNNGDYVKLETKSAVRVEALSGTVNFSFPFKNSNKINWYISSGYSFGNVKPISNTAEFSYQEPQINIIMESKEKPYSSILFETGLSLHPGKKLIMNTFLGYNYSANTIFSCNYYLSTSSREGSSLISSNGSGFCVGATLSYVLFNFKKKEKKLRYLPEYNEKEEIIGINGREIKSEHEIIVKSNTLNVQIRDYGIDDGDKISLFLNEVRILKKYTLDHKIKKFQIYLKPGMNKLIVYAHNLGKDPPNTASVVIYNGQVKYPASIESNLGRCGAIKIIYDP